jgi:hypothetical protein
LTSGPKLQFGVWVWGWGWGNSQADADAAGAVNKDYLLPSWAAEVVPRLGPQKRRKNNAYFFDPGASTYDSGLGGISQRWFIEAYTNGAGSSLIASLRGKRSQLPQPPWSPRRRLEC